MTEIEMLYEGFFSRISCGNCGNVFDIEEDVSSGQQVQCDACGATGGIIGR